MDNTDWRESKPVIGIVVYNLLIVAICFIVWFILDIFNPEIAFWQVVAVAYGIIIVAIVVNIIKGKST